MDRLTHQEIASQMRASVYYRRSLIGLRLGFAGVLLAAGVILFAELDLGAIALFCLAGTFILGPAGILIGWINFFPLQRQIPIPPSPRYALLTFRDAFLGIPKMGSR